MSAQNYHRPDFYLLLLGHREREGMKEFNVSNLRNFPLNASWNKLLGKQGKY